MTCQPEPATKGHSAKRKTKRKVKLQNEEIYVEGQLAELAVGGFVYENGSWLRFSGACTLSYS